MLKNDYDFFHTTCNSETCVLDYFGIHDEMDNNKPAYLVFQKDKSWILTINNINNIEIEFHPIDNCLTILKEGTNNKDSLCDGFLFYSNNICFIELAESRHKSTEKCIEQLKSTIGYFKKKHSLNNFIKREAIVSNIKKITSSISIERQDNFKKETEFSLNINTKLDI